MKKHYIVLSALGCAAAAMLYFIWPPWDLYESSSRQKARVVYVYDGDNLKLHGVRPRLRLWGVDAAEKGEPGADIAKHRLRKLVWKKLVSYREIDRDRYGRIVARVFLENGQEVNKILIEEGVVEEYCHYSQGFYGHCSGGWN